MHKVSRSKRRRKRHSSSDTVQTNSTIGNPHDAIVRGYHEFPWEHSLDRVVKNVPYPNGLGRLMEEKAKGGSGSDEENVQGPKFDTRDVEAEHGTKMRSMKEQGGEKESTPAVTPTRECGEQASTQKQKQPLCSNIKSAHDSVKETVQLSDLLQPSKDMATAKIPEPKLHTLVPDPFGIERKPVLRKPIRPVTETTNSNVLRAEVKNTALEAFLLLFALGSFGACTICLVVMELLSRW